jgi:bifunctional DNA-binding transcriptional regulator/antitoxin component of YhaV-PrlF toxin-antitoxin module
LPKQVREKLELGTGDPIDFVIQPNGDVLLKPAKFDIRKLQGILKSRKKRPVTVEEMNAAIRSRARKLK